MKKLLSVLLTLAVLSAALGVTASAEEAGPAPEAPERAPAFARVWGKVSPWEGEGIYLKNDSGDGSLNEVVVHPGQAPAVDASTGLPLDLEKVKEGDTLYVWTSPMMALSMPPQVSAKVLVGSVPADAAAPEYFELSSGGWKDPAGGDEIIFSHWDAEGKHQDLAVPLDAEVTPWLTRQIIRLDDIRPGSQILAWRDAKGAVSKVLVFPYAYQGYAGWNTAGTGVVNGEMVSVPGKVLPGEGREKTYLLPVRAMAEAAGYSVSWDKNRGAVVYDENTEVVFYVWPGDDVLWTPEGEVTISSPCVLEQGVTYLPAEDLCRALNLYCF